MRRQVSIGDKFIFLGSGRYNGKAFVITSLPEENMSGRGYWNHSELKTESMWTRGSFIDEELWEHVPVEQEDQPEIPHYGFRE